MQSNPFSSFGSDIRDLENKLHTKADTWQLQELENKIGTLKENITNLQDRVSWLENKISQLEEKNNDINQ
jgi:predicted  nucleic acid-binding Zn-ribbon protein